jgi:hypothetical protein
LERGGEGAAVIKAYVTRDIQLGVGGIPLEVGDCTEGASAVIDLDGTRIRQQEEARAGGCVTLTGRACWNNGRASCAGLLNATRGRSRNGYDTSLLIYLEGIKSGRPR